MNTGVVLPMDLPTAWVQVLRMQTKLHRWATMDEQRRFDDLYNLVYDLGFLTMAWDQVRSNRGARTAGVDGIKPWGLTGQVASDWLTNLREQIKSRTFTPDRVRQAVIPKAGGKKRYLGIPTAADRVVQASLKVSFGTDL